MEKEWQGALNTSLKGNIWSWDDVACAV